MSFYCRQFFVISEKLIRSNKLQIILRSVWFLQEFSKKFSEKLIIRYFFDENDEKKMKFENLIDQALRFACSKSAIFKIRQTEYKTKRSTILVKKMKSIFEKNVRDHSSNLLRVIKQRRRLSSKIDIRLNDLTEIMKKMIVNVNNLMNYVFFFDERENSKSEQYSFQISSRYSFSDSSFFDFAAFFSSRYSSQESMSLSQSFQISFFVSSSMFSSMSLINEALRSSQNKCIYCYSADHLYKRDC